MSVLRKPVVSEQYGKHFIGAQADFSELDLDGAHPGHAMVERHNPKKHRPLLVFLNAEGKEIARHTGKLVDEKDALRLARYVAERHYLKTDWPSFRNQGR